MEISNNSPTQHKLGQSSQQPKGPTTNFFVANKKKIMYLSISLIVITLLAIFLRGEEPPNKYPNVYKYEEDKVNEKITAVAIPRDTTCYTQGLSFINSTHLLESCGLYQGSYFHILQYTRTSGHGSVKETFKSQPFGQQFFLKGSVYFPKNNMIYILTQQDHVVFRYDAATLKEVDRLPWKRAGWGITHNNTHLIISDGSSSLYIVNESLDILKELKFIDELGHPYEFFNQLQWVQENGQQYVYANVPTKKYIVKISLSSRKIVARKKLDEMVDGQVKQKHYQEMNGIAYNGKSFLLTGKLWGSFYRIEKM